MKDLATTAPDDQDAWYHDPLGRWVEQTEQALLLDVLALHEGQTVVDINAGTGRLARTLAASTGANLLAAEPCRSVRDIGEARTRGLPVRWLSGGPESLPVDDATADVVLLITVLEFVPDRYRVFEEARRVLRPGGKLVVGALNVLSPWAALYHHLGQQGIGPWASAHLWTPDQLAQLLGISDAEVRGGVYLSPAAQPPFREADAAGMRAGNRPAFLVASCTK